jgi:exonuclease III
VRSKISAPQATFFSIDMTSKRPLLGPAVAVIKTTSINIEGFSTNKSDIIFEICMQNECDVISFQETLEEKNSIRSMIKNMKLAIEIPHNKYDSAVFIKRDSKILLTNYTDHNDIEILTIELTNCTIISIYKPLCIPFQFDQT